MTLSPRWAGFIKGVLTAAVVGVVAFLANSVNLTGFLNPTLAAFVAGIFSMIETSMKANTNGTSALFGAVRVSKY